MDRGVGIAAVGSGVGSSGSRRPVRDGTDLEEQSWRKARTGVVPGRLIRGAWQTPEALRRIIDRERIKTIVTLTAINRDDPKYVAQAKVVAETGVDWLIVPMRGSRRPSTRWPRPRTCWPIRARQPVFFHCVAGHHRTSLAHAAYLIRHARLVGGGRLEGSRQSSLGST